MMDSWYIFLISQLRLSVLSRVKQPVADKLVRSQFVFFAEKVDIAVEKYLFRLIMLVYAGSIKNTGARLGPHRFLLLLKGKAHGRENKKKKIAGRTGRPENQIPVGVMGCDIRSIQS